MIRAGALILLMLAITGCESTQQKSAQLEKQAKHNVLSGERGLSITRPSTLVKVLSAQILHDSERTAAVITLRNTSSRPLRDTPIAITVRGNGGKVVFQNNTPGIETALTSMALLEPGAQAVWIDDQVQASQAPTSVSALVGEGSPAPPRLPRLTVAGVHLTESATSSATAAGTVSNDSAIAQMNLVIYAIARRGGKIVAAGRALVAELPAHASSPFEVFFVGNPRGAALQMSAPATTLS